MEEAAPSNPTPRTIMVKERVKEEKTYMDARGYLVCEEVWVEREVEKTVTEAQAAAAASKPKVQIRAEMPKARLQRQGAERHGDGGRGDWREQGEEVGKGEGRAAAD